MKTSKILLGLLISLFAYTSITFGNEPGFTGYPLDFIGFSDILSEKFQEVHFGHLNSDFGGAFFITEVINVNKEITIQGTSHKVTCEQKLRGYYRNPIRGSQLVYPISKEDLDSEFNAGKYANLTIDAEDGFYTQCIGYTDTIIGQVNYKYNGNRYFSIVAGRFYNTNNGLINSTKGFGNTFQFYKGVTPIGLMYDSSLGLGMVGAHIVEGNDKQYVTGAISDSDGFNKLVERINNDDNVNKFISKIENRIVDFCNSTPGPGEPSCIYGRRGDINVVAKNVIGVLGGQSIGLGGVGNNSNMNSTTKQLATYKGDSYTQISYSLGTSFNSLSNSLNKIKKNGELLCKGKREVINSATTIRVSDINSKIKPGTVNCFDGTNSNSEIRLIVDEDISGDGKVTTIMTKGGDFVVIVGASQVNDGYLNIYVDGGVLAVLDPASTLPNNLVKFNGEGEYTNGAGVASGFLLKGNYFVNGVLGGWQGSYNEVTSNAFKSYRHKLYIHGTLGSLNTIEDPKQARKDLIISMLKNIIPSQTVYEGIINLKNAFSWRCKETQAQGTDGTRCSLVSVDQWSSNAIIVINKTLPNKLFNN